MYDAMCSVPTNANDLHSVQRLNNIPQVGAMSMLCKSNSMLEDILCKATDISNTVRGAAKMPDGNIPTPECMMDAVKGNMELIARIDAILGGILEVL